MIPKTMYSYIYIYIYIWNFICKEKAYSVEYPTSISIAFKILSFPLST